MMFYVASSAQVLQPTLLPNLLAHPLDCGSLLPLSDGVAD